MTVKELCEALSVNSRVKVFKATETEDLLTADFFSRSIGAIDESVSELEVSTIGVSASIGAVTEFDLFVKGAEIDG